MLRARDLPVLRRRPGERRQATPVGRPHRPIGSAMDQQEGNWLDKADDPGGLGRPQVATDAPAGERKHATREDPPEHPTDRQPHPVRDRDPEVRRDRLGNGADDPRPRRLHPCRRRRRIEIGLGQRAIAQDDDRGDRNDAAHR